MSVIYKWCCGWCYDSDDELYEPLMDDNESNAISELLVYLENQADRDFFDNNVLRSLSTLVYSNRIQLQRTAALAFAEITEKDVRVVDRETIEPLLFLLHSNDQEVQRASSAALGNLAVNTTNKVNIVRLGGLEPLIRLMTSQNVEVQCNAVGCITNLATHDENKNKIARSSALGPLTRLARAKDIRVQRNATGALLNMTHSGNPPFKLWLILDENRALLVQAGAMPVLVQLLLSPDPDIQYYCTTAISNIAVDPTNRERLAQNERGLVSSLVKLMAGESELVAGQAALASRNLASDANYQLDIVRNGGLVPLAKLITSNKLPLILSAVACIRNISIHPLNETPIIDSGFLPHLVRLLDRTEDEVLCHTVITMRNLAASSDRNKRALISAQAVQKCIKVLERKKKAYSVESEITAFFAVLAMSDELKRLLLGMGLCEVLVPLTSSENVEVQGNSAAAISNLASSAGDYSNFVRTWEKPGDGLRGFLLRFLASRDEIDQHIAVWTLTQLLESDDRAIEILIRKTPELPDLLRAILRNAVSPDEAVDDSDFEDESGGEENFEEGNEVVNLCRSALISFKKLPTLEELERLTGQEGKGNGEEDVPVGKHGEQA